MNELNDYSDEIYESLCDNEVDKVREAINNLSKLLEGLEDSLDLEY